MFFAFDLGRRCVRQAWGMAAEGLRRLVSLAERPRYYPDAVLADVSPMHPGAFFHPRTLGDVLGQHRLATAFLVSVLVHLAFYGTWRYGKHLGWWEHQATWLLNLTKKANPVMSASHLQRLLEARQRELQQTIPLTFAEVDPTAAATEAPKDAKYYGAMNSKAANPEAKLETTVPKIDGKQEKVVRVEDNPRPKPEPLQPAVASPPKEAPGNVALTKPDPGVRDAVQVVPDRPRTLAEARRRQGLAGEMMRQEGGVSRRGRLSLDVKATAFGAYDAALIAAVQQRWYNLLDSAPFAQRSGKVVLQFRLHYDGRISDMEVNENEVGDILALLCQRAIKDPSPYPRWPSDMRRAVGRDYREVLFTFYYN